MQELYIHSLKGRLRLRVPGIKNAPEKAAQIETQLRTMSGMARVTANWRTGSVLFNYDAGTLAPERIVQELVRRGYYAGPELSFARVRTVAARARDRALDKVFERAALKLGLSLVEFGIKRAFLALF